MQQKTGCSYNTYPLFSIPFASVCCPGEYDPERVCLMKGSRPELGSRYSVCLMKDSRPELGSKYSVCHARPLHCIRPLWRRVKRCLTGLSVSAPPPSRGDAQQQNCQRHISLLTLEDLQSNSSYYLTVVIHITGLIYHAWFTIATLGFVNVMWNMLLVAAIDTL